MSTHIKDIKGKCEEGEPNLSITRFWGGKEPMVQLTICGYGVSYIQLTQKQTSELAKVLLDSFDHDKYPSE